MCCRAVGSPVFSLQGIGVSHSGSAYVGGPSLDVGATPMCRLCVCFLCGSCWKILVGLTCEWLELGACLLIPSRMVKLPCTCKENPMQSYQRAREEGDPSLHAGQSGAAQLLSILCVSGPDTTFSTRPFSTRGQFCPGLLVQLFPGILTPVWVPTSILVRQYDPEVEAVGSGASNPSSVSQ